MLRPRRDRNPRPAPASWTRGRLQLLLAGALLVVLLLLVVGAVTAVGERNSAPSAGTGSTYETTHAPRSVVDRIADAPMHIASAQDAQPGQLAVVSAPQLELPTAAGQGPAAVATGFPNTPEGALAQLIAIDQQAMQPLSIIGAQRVIQGWAQPGGPTPTSWSGVKAVARLLSSAGMPVGQDTLSLDLRPAMGQIKGAAGRDFVVPCVDFVATVTAGRAAPQRVAVADCERMLWDAGRWMIAPGPEPAPAPSIWPGTRVSYAAGYRWLVNAP